MSDDEIIKLLEEMRSMFSTPLPDPIHEPLRFKYYFNLYNHTKNRPLPREDNS